MALPLTSIIAFTAAAALLTVTPGLDTALVLRTAAAEGAKRALLAGAGIALGCLVWGLAVAVGLSALFAASELAYTIMRIVGAAYLAWLGVKLLLRPRDGLDLATAGSAKSVSAPRWFARGFLTNLLNPKVGMFYISFLPQFVPAGANVTATIVLLATIHAMLGLIWFAAIVAATRPIALILRRNAVVRWLDRLTGGLFIAFGLRLAFDGRPA